MKKEPDNLEELYEPRSREERAQHIKAVAKRIGTGIVNAGATANKVLDKISSGPGTGIFGQQESRPRPKAKPRAKKASASRGGQQVVIHVHTGGGSSGGSSSGKKKRKKSSGGSGPYSKGWME